MDNTAVKLSDDEQMFLSNIPDEGSIGNIALRKKLNWGDAEKYWGIRDTLAEKNKVGIGSGKGGSVYRIDDTPDESSIEKQNPVPEEKMLSPSNVVAIDKKEKELEKTYYPHVRKFINIWARDNGYESFIVSETAAQAGNKRTGKWSRPDITFISVETFMFQPRKYLDVISFEVKPPNNVDITSVFETAAQSRSATKSYLVQFVPDDQTAIENELERIENECKRFGLGLIICKATKAEDYESYDETVEPVNRLPDPKDVEKFIKAQVHPLDQSKLMLLLR